MAKEEEIEVEGVVKEAVRGKFKVEILADSQQGAIEVLAHLSGKLKKNFIAIVPGDKVKIGISPYDLTKGRIVYRIK